MYLAEELWSLCRTDGTFVSEQKQNTKY